METLRADAGLLLLLPCSPSSCSCIFLFGDSLYFRSRVAFSAHGVAFRQPRPASDWLDIFLPRGSVPAVPHGSHIGSFFLSIFPASCSWVYGTMQSGHAARMTSPSEMIRILVRLRLWLILVLCGPRTWVGFAILALRCGSFLFDFAHVMTNVDMHGPCSVQSRGCTEPDVYHRGVRGLHC